MTHPDPASNVSGFHVRGVRYLAPIQSDEFADIEDAIALAEYWLWEGHCMEREIWHGDERVLDHAQTMERMKAQHATG